MKKLCVLIVVYFFLYQLTPLHAQDPPSVQDFIELEQIGKGGVFDIELSPDGKYLAAGGYNIWIYEVESRELVSVVEAIGVNKIAWSPDGTQIASGGGEGIVQIWDVKTGEQIALYDGDIAPTLSLDWSPDGKYILFPGGVSGTTYTQDLQFSVYVWDISKEEIILDIPAEAGQIMSVAWSNDGTLFATASEFANVTVWDSLTGTKLEYESPEEMYSRVWGLEWSSDDEFIAATTDYSTTVVWDFRQSTSVYIDYGENSAISTLAWSPEEHGLAFGTYDGQVQLWELDSQQFKQTLDGHSAQINDIEWLPDGSQIVTAGSDGKIGFWDSQTLGPLGSIDGHYRRMTNFAWSADGSHLVFTVYGDTTLRVWDFEKQTVIAALSLETGDAFDVEWSSNGDYIAVSSRSKSVYIWSTDKFDLVQVLNFENKQSIHIHVVWSPDGKYLAMAIAGDIIIWDAIAQSQLIDFQAYDSSVDSISWSPDGTYLATAGWFGGVRLWDTSTWTLSTQTDTQLVQSTLREIDWSSDGTLIAAATSDGYLLWDTTSGQVISTQPECEFANGVYDVAWVPNSRQLLIIGCSNRLQLWDVGSDTVVELDKIPVDSFTRVVWSPDGSRFATNYGSVIKIWG